jgi:hypothetical protein
MSQSISTDETALRNDLNDACRSAADRELVERAQEGDPEAFATLFHAHKGEDLLNLPAHDQQRHKPRTSPRTRSCRCSASSPLSGETRLSLRGCTESR